MSTTGTRKWGWCLDGHHANCAGHNPQAWPNPCTCTCRNEDPK